MWAVLMYRNKPPSDRFVPSPQFMGWHPKKADAQRVYTNCIHEHPERYAMLIKRAEHYEPKGDDN